MPRPLRVFVCHSSGDKEPIRQLYQRLRGIGVDPWLDEESLLPGQDWHEEITQAVRASDVVLVCISGRSRTKEGFVQREIKYALDVADEKPEGTIYLIPVRLEECEVPTRLGRWHRVDLFEERGFEKLIQSLKRRAETLGIEPPEGFPVARERTESGRSREPIVPIHPGASVTRANIAIIGEAGHGKTTLTAAIASSLAKFDPTIRLRSFDSINDAVEEKARGMSGAMVEVEYRSRSRHYVQADFRCHEDCVDSMMASSGMDGMILAVAITEGPTQNVQQQILASRQGHVPCIAVVLTKADLADDSGRSNSAESDVRAMLTGYGFPGDDLPIVRASPRGALKGERRWEKSIEDLIAAVDQSLSADSGPRGQLSSHGDAGQPLLIPIEEAYFLKGRGTLARGRIERGVVKIDDRVEIVGLRATRATRVSGVEILGAWVDEGRAGDSVGLLLPATRVEEVERGQVIALPESVTAHRRFEAEIYMLQPEEGGRRAALFARSWSEFQLRAARVRGMVTLPEGVDSVCPGDNSTLFVELMSPVVMTKGLRFVLRDGANIVAAGTVSNVE